MLTLDTEHIRAKYRDRMLQLAFVVSGWSPCPEGQRHGCVLAFNGKYIVATGFNGPDRDWKPTKGQQKCACDDCKAPVVHAEVNALLNLRTVLGPHRYGALDGDGLVAYVTKKPCGPCMKALKDAGAQAIMWLQDLGSGESTWTR